MKNLSATQVSNGTVNDTTSPGLSQDSTMHELRENPPVVPNSQELLQFIWFLLYKIQFNITDAFFWFPNNWIGVDDQSKMNNSNMNCQPIFDQYIISADGSFDRHYKWNTYSW